MSFHSDRQAGILATASAVYGELVVLRRVLLLAWILHMELAAANDTPGYDYLSSRPGSILRNAQKKWRKRLASTP
jgi:hypothetical protein